MNKQKCDAALSCIFNTHLIGVYADFYGDFSSLKPNGEVEEPIKNCNLNFFSYQVSWLLHYYNVEPMIHAVARLISKIFILCFAVGLSSWSWS